MGKTPGTATPTSTQEVGLWIAGALLTLSWFGFLTLLAAQVEDLDLGHRLFQLFDASLLHNAVHLLLGIATFVVARSYQACRTFLRFTGAALLTVAAFGQLDPAAALGGLVPTGTADGVLHVVLGLAMIAASLIPADQRRRRTA